MSISGDGLIPPVNAPAGQQALPGVQPGISPISFARVVLVFGPSGAVSGVFVYTPGTTPGPGNPPVISITESSTDPYGNAVAGGVTVGLPTNTQVQMQSGGGVGLLNFLLNSAALSNAQIRSTVTPFGQLLLSGPASTVAGHTDQVSQQWNASDGVSSSANGALVYVDATGTPHFPASWSAAGFNSLAGSVNGVEPGTGTVATPAAAESPHAATLLNGWTASGAGYNGAFYWRDPDITASPTGTVLGQLHIAFDLQAPAGVAANSQIFQLPANYIPQMNQNVGIVGWNNPQVNNSASPAWLFVSNTGVVQITGIQNNKEFFGHYIAPMGTL